MNIADVMRKLFSFENQKREFELLETESGQPGYSTTLNSRETDKNVDCGGKRISQSLNETEMWLKRDFRSDINPDIIFRRFKLGGRVDALALFINGMASADQVSDFILREAMRRGVIDGVQRPYAKFVAETVLTLSETELSADYGKVKTAALEGRTAVLIDGDEEAILLDTRGFAHRSVGAPENEKVVRGPHEGFNENIRTNITLLRRMIKTEDLVCEFRDAGGDNRIKAAIVYREGIANTTLIEEVKRRMARVDTRMVLNSGMLEQLTEESSLSPFPQVLATERPDRAASFLMQGYVAVLLDGSPYANVMPVTLSALMTSLEDIFLREPQGSIIRMVRYLGVFISIMLPGYFLALALHHQGLLSTEVLSTVVSSRKMVFAPIGMELIFLLIVFQLIREAGLRVPGSIGQAIGIIGGLILGQAAVSANLASSVVLIVVALSGLGNFCIPDYSTQLAASYFRILIVICAWMAGLLGMACALLTVIALTASLKSYGVPFLSPFAPVAYTKRPLIRRGKITMHKRTADLVNSMEERVR